MNESSEPQNLIDTKDAEFRTHLQNHFKRPLAKFPIDLFVEHVLRIAPFDFEARMGTADAIIRRVGSCRLADAMVSFPDAWTLQVASAANAPGHIVLWNDAVPFQSSCDCADFQRNSLSLCKHTLIAWLHFLAHPRAQKPTYVQPRLCWNPVRAWTGVDAPDRRLMLDGTPLSFIERSPIEQLRTLRSKILKKQLSAEPCVLPLIESELNLLKRKEKCSEVLAQVPSLLKTLNKKIFPYQKEGVEKFIAMGRLLLADDMGLGKTIQAIASTHILLKSKTISRALLIVPAALKAQWEREWSTFSDLPILSLDFGPEQRREIYESGGKGVLLANYEQVLKDLPLIQKWDPQLVVLDEAQRIKNWASKTALFVKQLHPAYRLVLSGTPFENRLSELASLVEWVDDHALEPKWRLTCFHQVRADGEQSITGAKNLSTLRDRLAPCMMRRIRQEVLAQLPPRSNQPHWVGWTPEQQSEHDLYREPIKKLMAKGAQRPLLPKEFLRLMMLLGLQRQICNGLALVDFDEKWNNISKNAPTPDFLSSLFSPKLAEFRELISQVVVQQKRKVVIFSQYRRMLQLAHWAVNDVLNQEGIESVFFTGQEATRRRTENIIRFHDHADTRLFFATDAGGVGLNLQKAASSIINLEYPWNPAVLEQRVGRVFRLGQTQPVDVFLLGSASGIEARIAGVVADKHALFKGLFDGDSDEVTFERAGGFMKQLQRIVEVDAPEIAAVEGKTVTMEDADDAIDLLPEVIAEQSAAVSSIENAPVGYIPKIEAPPIHNPAQIAQLFSNIRITPKTDGGMTIDATPEAAATLGALLMGLGQMLSNAAPSVPQNKVA